MLSHRSRLFWAVLLILCLAVPAQASPSADKSADAWLTLPDALEALREEGIETLYTHRLVTHAQRVETWPREGSAKRRLRALLSPFGLRAKPTSDGTWVVVPARSGTVEGCLTADPGGQPVVDASVTMEGGGLEARSNPDGCYRLLDVPAGQHGLDVSRPGYIPHRLQVHVEPGGVHRRDGSLRLDAELNDAIFVSTAPERPPLGTWRMPAADRRSAALSDPDLLTAVGRQPGIDGAAGVSFGVRGHAEGRLVLVVDGIDIVEPHHLRHLGSPAAVVPPDAVAEIQLHRGSPPLTYGNRAGGVLEMVTRTPQGRFAGRLGGGAESMRATVHGSLFGGRGRWLIAYREGRPEVPEEIGEFDSRPSYWNGTVKLSAALSESHDLSLQNLRADDAFGFLRIGIPDNQSLFLDQVSRHTGLRYLATFGRKHLVEALLTDADVSRLRESSELDSNLFTESPLERTYLLDDRRETRRWVRRVEVKSHLGERYDLHWGIESSRERTAYTHTAFNQFDLSLGRAGRFDRWLNESRWGAFAQATWRPRADLTLEIGGRYDDSRWSESTGLAPRLAVSLRRGDGVWRAGWTRAISTGATHELLLADGLEVLPGVETSDFLAVGYVHARARHTLAAELYSQRIDEPRLRFENLYKPISRIAELEIDRRRIEASEARLEGLEVRFETRGRGAPNRSWRAGLTYQLSRAEDRLDGRWFARRGDRRHSALAWLTVELPRDLQLDLRWSGASGAPTTPFDLERFAAEGFRAAVGEYHAERLPAQHQLDLRLSTSVSWLGTTLAGEIGVDNVTDRVGIRGFDLIGLGQGSGLRPETGLGRRFRWGLELSF